VLGVGFGATAVLVGILFNGLGKDPSAIESPLLGKPAPAFALRELGGTTPVSLHQFRGKPLVVNFWATWCGPCYEEHPVLVAGARSEPRVQFAGVVFQDTEPKIRQFLAERGSAYPTLIDAGGKTAIAYGVGGVPETFFIDAGGVIVAKHSGPLTPDLLQSNLQKVLQP
jgi:cytochrome c biogenesis protein CcmG/thiol:disulfide interchange protein DsbE